MKKLLLTLCALLVSGSACGLFFPFGLDSLAETRIYAICHFIYSCCTPVERALFANQAPFKDEGACRAEASEDRTFGAFVFAADQLAKDAVARGAAEYDGEAAERCSRAQLEAVNACDPEAVLNRAGSIDFAKLVLLVDPADAECAALAARSYTRGLVGDGDECLSDFDCADFGDCLVEEEDTVTTVGKCVTPHQEGDECVDGRPCVPGLVCQAPEGGGAPVCSEPVLKENGEECVADGECESGFCEEREVTVCFFSGEPCTVDADCTDVGDTCDDVDFVSTCAGQPDVTFEICDGQ